MSVTQKTFFGATVSPIRPWAIFLFFLLAAGAGATAARGAEAEQPRFDAASLFHTPSHPALLEAARRAGFPTEGIPVAEESGPPRPGDAVIALVTLTVPNQMRQWLVIVEMSDPELARDPPPPLTLYSSSGNNFQFESALAEVVVHTFGPLSLGQGSVPPGVDQAVKARAVVNREFLALGFDRACDTMFRLKAARRSGRVGKDELFGFSGERYDRAAVAEGRDIAARAGLSYEDERAFAATGPALTTYVQLVAQTEGLNRILQAVVERPSVWSVIRRFGRVNWNIRYFSEGVEPLPGEWMGLPADVRLRQLPFVLFLNAQPAMECLLVIAAPDPPLLSCAGIVGLLARRPGSEERLLAIRLLAARRGGGKGE